MEPKEEPRNSSEEKTKWTQQDIMDRFSCPVCLETYNEPLILRCGHSFCKECLEDLNPDMQGPVSCPSCRTESKVEEATRNFALEQLLDIYEYSISMVSVYQSHSSQEPVQKPQQAPDSSSSSSSAIASSSAPSKHSRFVFIESQYAGAVIGTKRSRLQQVESATSTRISVPPRRRDVELAPTDLIEFTITGTNERNVDIAAHRVQAAAEACKRKNDKKLATNKAKEAEIEAIRKKADEVARLAEEQRRLALLEQEQRSLAASQERELNRLRQEQEAQRKRAEIEASAERQRSLEMAALQKRRQEEEQRRKQQELADLLEAQRLQEMYDREHQDAILARSHSGQQRAPAPAPMVANPPPPAPAKQQPAPFVYPGLQPQPQQNQGSGAPNQADGACVVM